MAGAGPGAGNGRPGRGPSLALTTAVIIRVLLAWSRAGAAVLVASHDHALLAAVDATPTHSG